MMWTITNNLKDADAFLRMGDIPRALNNLNSALFSARHLQDGVVKHRCLRAHIAQAIEALS